MIFELFQKLYLQIYASQFMASYIIPLPFALLSLESVEKKGKKLQKFEYLENEKSFLVEIKNFHSFWRPIIWWKDKNLIKNSGHKLEVMFSILTFVFPILPSLPDILQAWFHWRRKLVSLGHVDKYQTHLWGFVQVEPRLSV